MFDALIKFIEQRMAQRGFPPGTYKWEPIRVQGSGQSLHIDAMNQYYYLAAKTTKASLKIISDTEVFNEGGAAYANFQFYGFKEFSGAMDITVTAPDTIDIEFIRVVPETPAHAKSAC